MGRGRDDGAADLSRGRAAAGALALVLPPDDGGRRGARPRCSTASTALLLAGGADVDPASYGAAPHPETGRHLARARPLRDRAGARGRSSAGCPVLGVCRGMQILNVALRGTLDQHLPDVIGSDDHRHTPGAFGDHEVRLEPGSLAATGGRSRARARQVPPPPGSRRAGGGPRRHRLVAGRRAGRGDRAAGRARSCSACSGIPRRTSRAG